ncbi:MAG: hypothetical protein V4590_12345, partial [Bacteroidota bacterium]
MKKTITPLLFVVLFLGTLMVRAQIPQYVTGVLPATAGGNTIPFYYTGTGCRGQQLYPAGAFGVVPTGMAINKIYFASTTSGSQLYSNFEVGLGQPNVATLTTTYEVTTKVLNEINYTLTRVANSWFVITLTTPYIFDPTLPLVIEINQLNSGGATHSSFVQTTIPGTARNYSQAYNSATAAGAGAYMLYFGFDLTTASSGGGPATVPPIASFAYTKSPMDTVWVSSPRTMVNTSSGASKSYWDILGFNAVTKNGPYAAFPETRTPKTSDGINDVFIDTINNAVNFRYTYPDRGFYRVKVTALNKFGTDTYIDTIYVDTPATKPKADFFSDKRIVGVYDFASMFDLTNNGPVSWFWYIKPGYYNPLAPFFNSFSPSAGAQNPILNANEGGLFDVCLVATNYRGTDTMCKPGYVKIISGYEVCKGSSTGKDTIARENEGSAKLYTVGGKYVPNLIGTCSKGFTIATCSDTATLFIDRFRMRSNVTAGVSDSLLIRLGSSTGPILARMGGTILPAAFSTIKVPGGIAYLQTIIANPGSGTPPGDSGYVVRWNAPPASYGKPNASFNMPDTVYDGYTVQFVNTTTGKNASYAWDTNGDNVFGIDNPSSGVDSINKNPTRTFAVFAPYTAKLCLKAFNCVGSDTFCKTIQFLPVAATPAADFTVNRIKGFTTDTFRFTDESQNGPNKWTWSFVPNNVAYLSGTNANSQNPILLLNSAINYDVTLTATNQQGSNTKTKLAFVSANAYGNPGCSGCPISNGQPYLPGSLDLGITRVTLADMDTTTALNTPIYHALFTVKSANVYRGVTYTLATARPTANDPMSTRGWIDFNRNTNFGDEAI